MEQVVIIGAGPAGTTAAIYCARANLKPLVFEGIELPGGQLITTTDVENFPGFPDGIYGSDIVSRMKSQAIRFGAKFIQEDVVSLDLVNDEIRVISSKQNIVTKSLIVATGASPRKLNVPGAVEFWQKGISTCATCDGALPMFRNNPVAVIGGGDSAMEEAMFLSRFASQVIIIHRRDKFRASQIMSERALKNHKIFVLWDSVVREIKGDSRVRSIVTENTKNGKMDERSLSGIFFAIGHDPCSSLVSNIIELDDSGYIKVLPGSSITSVPGVFAAGDVCDPVYRQAVTAAGSGCIAAIDCERWLSGNS